jgi:hypothetical protein
MLINPINEQIKIGDIFSIYELQNMIAGDTYVVFFEYEGCHYLKNTFSLVKSIPLESKFIRLKNLNRNMVFVYYGTVEGNKLVRKTAEEFKIYVQLNDGDAAGPLADPQSFN